MRVSIASGKGGTGKTTVAVNLALSLSGPVQLIDCDVEEPNCHLFLEPKIEETKVINTFVPTIRAELCTACKKCAEICRFRALTVVGGKVLVFPELCHSCGGCQAVCPENAVAEDSRSLGVIETGKAGALFFRHGRLRVGEAMAPPLIRQALSGSKPCDTTIIDAPPGTSCPVIAAMRDSDFVLLVTEPTPFGLHDLKLAVEAVKTLGIPHGLVINRADMGDRKVTEFAMRQNIPILLEIPFDRRIAETYSQGIPMVTAMPEWREAFCRMYEHIKTLVAGKRRMP